MHNKQPLETAAAVRRKKEKAYTPLSEVFAPAGITDYYIKLISQIIDLPPMRVQRSEQDNQKLSHIVQQITELQTETALCEVSMPGQKAGSSNEEHFEHRFHHRLREMPSLPARLLYT